MSALIFVDTNNGNTILRFFDGKDSVIGSITRENSELLQLNGKVSVSCVVELVRHLQLFAEQKELINEELVRPISVNQSNMNGNGEFFGWKREGDEVIILKKYEDDVWLEIAKITFDEALSLSSLLYTIREYILNERKRCQTS